MDLLPRNCIATPPSPLTFKVYTRRWVMLCLFILCSIISHVQWIAYSIIADSIVKFHGISYEMVNWTSMIFLLLYIPFVFPGVYVINKLGVRKSLLLATFATLAGAWLSVGGVSKDRFWVYMLGSTIVAMSVVVFYALPVPIASVWFGENEVSTACGLGVFGLQLGIAFGFVVPPMVVRHHGTIEDIEYELYLLNIGSAAFCTVIFCATFWIFEDEPPTPPSLARLKQSSHGKMDFIPSFLRLIKNQSYMLLALSYGIVAGLFYGMSTLLNQIVLKYYSDAREDAGRIGLVIVIAGMVGAIVFGVTMDKLHKFKETTYFAYFGSFASVLVFSFTLQHGLPVFYVMAILIGFFVIGVFPVGYELAVELTYPEPECISSGLLQIVSQAIGIGFTYLYSYLFYNISVLAANLTTAGLLLIGSILTLFIRFDLKRRKAQTEKQPALLAANA